MPDRGESWGRGPLTKPLGILLLAILVQVGCATRPIVYPNAYYRKVGKPQAEQDISRAMASAKQFGLNPNSHGNDAAEVTTDSAVGAATGAATGAVIGGGASAGVGAAAGAAGGAAAGGTRILFRWMFGQSMPAPAYRNFVERYLREKGYEVIGWD